MNKLIIFPVLAVVIILLGCGEDNAPYIAVWSIYREPNFGEISLHGVSGTSQSNVWAVGEAGTIMHYDGSVWTGYPSSPTTFKLYDVTVNYDGSGWAVGASGTTLILNNGYWLVYPPVTSQDLYAVISNDSDTGWAVGDCGTVLGYTGSEWKTVNHGQTEEHLRDVAVDSNGRVIIVGDNGVILEYAAGIWSKPTSPVTCRLSSVTADDNGTVFACGAGGAIIKRTSGGWVSIPTTDTEDLNVVDIYDADTGYIAGIHGALYEYSDGSWVPDGLPEVPNITVDVNDMTLIEDNNGWAVGNNGLVLRYGLVY